MVREENVIRVYSALNPWIDYVVLIYDSSEINAAKEIIQDCYNGWFSVRNQIDETMTDYISRRLNEVCIDHEIYFHWTKEEEEI